jgi:hypothetical protein
MDRNLYRYQEKINLYLSFLLSSYKNYFLAMTTDKYKKLFEISSKLEEMLKLKKKYGILNNFNIKIIPDDYKIEIFALYKKSLKSIKTTIIIKKKDEDTE